MVIPKALTGALILCDPASSDSWFSSTTLFPHVSGDTMLIYRAASSALRVNSRQLTRVVIGTLGGRRFVDALAVVARPSGTPGG